ncbi:hypothetical protein ATN89_17305 [Comamonas thiooxydans]|uniref:hypothetical protein n=1 Tax=Comamonas thiooxydans TaxID=363952 RepID=UPI0007C4FA97|nr:hypothetical protein [Comamonas thiooxydans]OAD82841.1 hypothetical protein ATN89_17305 [Comamonas thiooxydans]
MKTYFIAAHQIQAQDCLRGIFIDPVLPHGFHETANEERPFTHMVFWLQPYVVTNMQTYTVYCLDGGCWDRPTWRGDYQAISEAVDAARALRAKGANLSIGTLIPGTERSFGIEPLVTD